MHPIRGFSRKESKSPTTTVRRSKAWNFWQVVPYLVQGHRERQGENQKKMDKDKLSIPVVFETTIGNNHKTDPTKRFSDFVGFLS